MGCDGSPGGVRYRAPYSANNCKVRSCTSYLGHIWYPSNVEFCCMIDKTPVDSRSHRKHTSTKKHTRTLTNNVAATFKELTNLNQNIQGLFNEKTADSIF